MNLITFKKTGLTISLVLSFFLCVNLQAQTPTLNTNNLTVNSAALRSIDKSKEGELTIASMNVRDMVGRKRTLLNYQYLAGVLGDADIIVLQEIGAKGFYQSSKADMNKRVDAFIAVFKTYLGEEWHAVKAPHPTPEGLGGAAELPVLFYKSKAGEIEIACEWHNYADLGEKRDMGVFKVDLNKNGASMGFQLGTVHTKPDCPGRGKELLKMVEYINSTEESFILCGDFNWGYKSSCDDGYIGENRILALEEDGKIHMPFSEISYMGDGEDEDFRTNLMIRGAGHFYDQFVVSEDMVNKYADNCSLSKDCGFISISTSKEYQKEVEQEFKTQMKGAKQAVAVLKKNGCTIEDEAEIQSRIEATINGNWRTADAASYIISDHKPIWLQIKPFN